MALISCPECNKQISDKAKFCPHCGFPFIEERIDDLISNPKKDEKFEEKKNNNSYTKEEKKKENRMTVGYSQTKTALIILLLLYIFVAFSTMYNMTLG